MHMSRINSTSGVHLLNIFLARRTIYVMLWYAQNYAMYMSRINSTSGVHLLNIS
jgi:hypothetical protein